MRTLNFNQKSFSANAAPCEGGVIISNPSARGVICVPAQGIYLRSANAGQYGEFKKQLFIDGKFIGAVSMSRIDSMARLYNAGYPQEAASYAMGYTMWRETSLGGNHINPRKEAARISHALCDMPGKYGHELRQYIRRSILKL